MAKTDWKNDDIVKAQDMNDIGEEINNLRTDIDNIHIPDASLTEKGITQLSSATDSTAEDRAATPKAVKAAYDLANNALPKTGGTVTGDVSIVGNAGTLDLVGTDHVFMELFPKGRGAGRKGYIGFPAADTNNIVITNENVVDGDVVVFAKGQNISISELFTSVSNGKNDIASAIIDKGGSASGSDTFAQFAAAIRGLKGNVAMGYFDHASTSNLSITESVSGLSFTPRYVFMRIDTVANPGNRTRFLGLISNQPPFNFVIGLGARADLSSFIPAVGGFTVTVNFSITDSGITQLVSQFHEWIAVE